MAGWLGWMSGVHVLYSVVDGGDWDFRLDATLQLASEILSTAACFMTCLLCRFLELHRIRSCQEWHAFSFSDFIGRLEVNVVLFLFLGAGDCWFSNAFPVVWHQLTFIDNVMFEGLYIIYMFILCIFLWYNHSRIQSLLACRKCTKPRCKFCDLFDTRGK